MSADNWAVCPRCLRSKTNMKKALEQQINESYGKITIEEYKKLLDESGKPLDVKEDLREDYEIYIDEDGTFCVYYSGSCATCGFSYSFEHKKKLTL